MVDTNQLVLSALGVLIAMSSVLIAVLRLVIRNVGDLGRRLDGSIEASRLAHEAIGDRIDNLDTELKGQIERQGSEFRGQNEEARGQTDSLGAELRGRLDNLGVELRGRTNHIAEGLAEVREGVAFSKGRLLANEEG